MARLRARSHGFSLVELVGAAVIVGVLLVLGALQLVQVLERAKAGPVIHYLTELRAAQQNHRRTDDGPVVQPDPLPRPYAGSLSELDVDLALRSLIRGWDGPQLSASGPTGMATFDRNSGWYRGQQLGIQYGSGTLCGTFEPLFTPPAPCAAD